MLRFRPRAASSLYRMAELCRAHGAAAQDIRRRRPTR